MSLMGDVIGMMADSASHTPVEKPQVEGDDVVAKNFPQ